MRFVDKKFIIGFVAGPLYFPILRINPALKNRKGFMMPIYRISGKST